ncbi:RNA-binding region-containing protein (RNP-1) [Phytophthora cinnamomi]|uniref:RNA-binding region-containing protein (RNP-1) n=1 Tax=Phytophthora cinnamomi TaxID=4785 RepID=UPI003559D12A|nr:RNA-binding region-containing protein (RNP-1) [Phytophthora cinnamomi]
MQPASTSDEKPKTHENLKPYMSGVQKQKEGGQQASSSVVRFSSTKALSYEGLLSEEELVVLRAIVAREAGMDELLSCCCAFEEDRSVELLEALIRVRELSLATVDAVAGWRRRMIQIQPFLWRDLNYVLKMTCDLDFVSKSQLATAAMDGVRLPRRNPFSTIGGLDNSMRIFWAIEMPEEDDLSVLLDSASFAPSQVTVDLPSKIRLAECFLLYEEKRYGKFSRVQAAADHRLKELVQGEAEYSSKARFGAVTAPGE